MTDPMDTERIAEAKEWLHLMSCIPWMGNDKEKALNAVRYISELESQAGTMARYLTSFSPADHDAAVKAAREHIASTKGE